MEQGGSPCREEEESQPSGPTASSLYSSCEELEMINGPGRCDQREELRLLSSKLREMEEKWEALYTQHQEVCT